MSLLVPGLVHRIGGGDERRLLAWHNGVRFASRWEDQHQVVDVLDHGELEPRATIALAREEGSSPVFAVGPTSIVVHAHGMLRVWRHDELRGLVR